VGDERRREDRIPTHEKVEVRFASWDTLRLVYMIDISLGGMSISMARKPDLAPNEDVTVRLMMPDLTTFELEGTVRYVKELSATEQAHKPSPTPFRVGVALKPLTPEQKQQLERILESRPR